MTFAQFPLEIPADTTGGLSDSVSEPVVQTPPPVPVPEAPKPAPVPEGKTVFDVTRGHAYNPFGTLGAADNVNDFIITPSDIHGQKFLYISPSDRLGYTAFGFGGGTAFMGLSNASRPYLGALILGYATPAFGMALNYSVDKVWRSEKTPNILTGSSPEESIRITEPGDNIGLFFSMPLGASTIYANLSWLTKKQSYSMTVEGNANKDLNGDTMEDYSTIDVNLGLLGSMGSLNYDAYLNIVRTGGSYTDIEENKAVDTDTYLGTILHFNLGYTAAQSHNTRVIVGLNNEFGVMFFDKIGSLYKSDNIIGLIISPNILGEIALNDNWFAFAGAEHYIMLSAGDGNRNENNSVLKISSYRFNEEGGRIASTSALAGLRYQKTNWALETQLAAPIYSNPFAGFNGSDILASFGGFIYF